MSGNNVLDTMAKPKQFDNYQNVLGRCNICGEDARFFYQDTALYRESLNCEHCFATSRYRSIARGLLKALNKLIDGDYQSLSELPKTGINKKVKVYDTQQPFYWELNSYPIPDLLSNCDWIDVFLSSYKENSPLGDKLGINITNQNLENLTFPDSSFDIVITSDVMEHVRLDDKAHKEIKRVLKVDGVYLFTVPHGRNIHDTLVRVKINDPGDPTQDEFLMEPEYHGDTNSDEHEGVLSYRVYGTDLDENLTKLGMKVEYTGQNYPETGILNTELFYCTKLDNS